MNQKKEAERLNNNTYSPTPYDDVFRTLVNDCSRLVLPLINEAFGENYTGDEEIRFSPNEHFMNRQDGDEEKRITDSSFAVIGQNEKRYHLECQATPDHSILIRIFEYDAQIALDQDSEVIDNRIVVSFPHTTVLFLRSDSSTPDVMWIEIRTPGGSASYEIPVIKIKSYTIDDIFKKRLLFLIPFYIFTYEAQFKMIDKSDDRIRALKEDYREIRKRLEQLARNESINEFYKRTIIEMSEKVLSSIARNYEKIRKGVEAVMGGQVLDYEAKRILNEGRKEGLEKGIEKGIEKGMLNTLASLVEDGILSFKDAATRAGLSESKFRERLAELAD